MCCFAFHCENVTTTERASETVRRRFCLRHQLTIVAPFCRTLGPHHAPARERHIHYCVVVQLRFDSSESAHLLLCARTRTRPTYKYTQHNTAFRHLCVTSLARGCCWLRGETPCNMDARARAVKLLHDLYLARRWWGARCVACGSGTDEPVAIATRANIYKNKKHKHLHPRIKEETEVHNTHVLCKRRGRVLCVKFEIFFIAKQYARVHSPPPL